MMNIWGRFVPQGVALGWANACLFGANISLLLCHVHYFLYRHRRLSRLHCEPFLELGDGLFNFSGRGVIELLAVSDLLPKRLVFVVDEFQEAFLPTVNVTSSL